ncbi:vacuolar protein sorting-associated protein 13D [Teleopsis dalmanni]|uniref:vacuolar protein sorting-associated protein 13D n=1 Tax=Teleopsis dalmanni TaxID=139649 RepID=UPI0018CF049F|nr:vacuolar protein sorting-associated protein 13D [Teleopsis dalmanni]
MLNELITWVLNTYLGKYLEDFNPQQLSVALLSGEVELENVPIRKDALYSFGIPVQAYSGYIGKIRLQIPVRQFRTAPWCIIIERIYGVFGPKNLEEWDDDKEKLSEYDIKLAQLDANEAEWRIKKGYETDNYYSTSYSSWLSYGTTLATNILENLELKISDVHIRYEDIVTINNVKIAGGIKINSLTVQSSDSNWVPGAKINNQNISYKIIELKDFSIYWDKMSDNNMCHKLSSKELLESMNSVCDVKEHHYILSPTTARAQFKRERCKQAIRSRSRPRLSCEVTIFEVKLSLSDVQYKEITECILGLHTISKIRSYRLKRPICKILENPALWWKYACNCHGYKYDSEEKKWLKLHENLRYIRLYKKLLLNPNENITADDKQFKLSMEKSRNLQDLQNLRDVCFTSVLNYSLNEKTQNLKQGKGMLYHWFPNWLGWYGNSEVNNQPQTQDETYKNIEDDILNALEDSIENNSFSKRDALFGHFTFNLVSGKFIILENEDSGYAVPKFEMQFSNLMSLIEMKSVFNSYLIGISLGSVCLKDILTQKTEFPDLIKPQLKETQSTNCSSPYIDFKKFFIKNLNNEDVEPWFQLQYEKSPVDITSDFRLVVKSRSLDIVYNKQSFEWLLSFMLQPLHKLRSKQVVQIQRHKTKLKFLDNWKQLLIGQQKHRKTWTFEIDISAPRIIFVDNFLEKSTSIVLVDFGRFQLLKNENKKNSEINNSVNNSEEDDLFMTPCSTPPGSEISRSESPTVCQDSLNSTKVVINNDTGLESALHNKIYDKYVITMTDLQVLVCKNRERGFASFKNSSNFHLLDKFNISLELERRVIYTSDPEYPAITLLATLPAIVAHINEQKISEFLKIMHPLTKNEFFNAKEKNTNIENFSSTSENFGDVEIDECNSSADLIIVRFTIGQVILEVQSCEKSIAELQIIGAKAELTKSQDDYDLNMSVHGLLLVDAIQSFGPDFELLMASHRHVGMDSISGSLKQSEPCSPNSPGSPDHTCYQRPTSPHIITKAVNNLQSEKNVAGVEFEEMNALITIDLSIVHSNEEELLQTASITFNNLDIIANQETIVELLGFMNRIAYTYKKFQESTESNNFQSSNKNESDGSMGTHIRRIRTEISFEFHRLNILVLRTLKKENVFVGRKVGTLTMSEAKIQAVLGKDIRVTGSLGGIQIIDITPEGVNHQRILSVGKDPLTDPPNLHGHNLLDTLVNEMYGINLCDSPFEQQNALVFTINRFDNSIPTAKIRMASVWYTHCPRFIQEINMCISQFKHFLKNFAKSLRTKATDMAMGLVHQLNQTDNKKLYIPSTKAGHISLDIILSSPVLILPRSSQSTDVFVANLGKITAYNTHEECELLVSSDVEGFDYTTKENYFIDIRNINLFSLNTSQRKELRLAALPKANEYYSCKNDAVAILHDTAMSFKFTKELWKSKTKAERRTQTTFSIDGSITQLLQLSLTRDQYEQLNESIENATKFVTETNMEDKSDERFPIHTSIKDKNGGDFHLKAKPKVYAKFSVPTFVIYLKNEHHNSAINITFREFKIFHSQIEDERNIQVILRSVLMEDLKCAIESKFRNMVDSSSDSKDNQKLRKSHCSTSCPNLARLSLQQSKLYSSMPTKLNCVSNVNVLRVQNNSEISSSAIRSNKQTIRDDNLVIYKSRTTTLNDSKFSSLRTTDSSIDFNCLNLTISLDRWFMVLDFFGLLSNNDNKNIQHSKTDNAIHERDFSQLKVSVRSLNLILVRNEMELTKANISNAFFKVTRENIVQEVEGSLGSLSLLDLTHFGNLYREKFSTTGDEALNFLYKRLHGDINGKGKRCLDFDAKLNIQMSSVRYIHTKRFLMEIHLFVKELLQLQTPVIKRIKSSDIDKDINSRPIQISLEIFAESPIVLLPLSYYSTQVIVADLGKVTLKNSFHFASDEIVISKKREDISFDEILDVMHVDLVNIDLFAAERIKGGKKAEKCITDRYLNVGSFTIQRLGNNLFEETCFLKLQVERNTDSHFSHNCPDISVKGTLSKLNGVVNLQQYKLIRGFLNYNLGETIDDVYNNYSNNFSESIEKLNMKYVPEYQKINDTWNTLSINLLLENVSILLNEQSNSETSDQSLTCINFIKSSLEIDSFSDGSQDIDLISREILIMDSRDNVNVFKHILQPRRESSSKDIVQAEIHSRKNANCSKYTILLNNMRIMAILDCLDSIKNFLKEEPYIYTTTNPIKQKVIKKSTSKSFNEQSNENFLEVVLNITDSEVVFAENLDKIDTNAIILKSTTVCSYKPNNDIIPMSIDINHLEIFSCILGLEEETALSILDPFTLNMELRKNCFHVSIQNQLCIRLSYNDVKLFLRMINSIPKQGLLLRKPTSTVGTEFESIAPLIAMGFSPKDCLYAMEINKYELNDAALWLSQQRLHSENSVFDIHDLYLNANRISICIIDDCMDADVPLLEFSMSRLKVKQKIAHKNPNESNNLVYLEGNLETVIGSDYYNRRLSGWEPIIEPWECLSSWRYSGTNAVKSKTANIYINSKQLLRLNITSTLIELCESVRKNWMQDYYGSTLNMSNNTSGLINYRRRTPFIPFALKNLTGEPLLFKTIFSQPGGITRTEVTQQDMVCNWISVEPFETVPFDFGPQTKLRHMDSHKLNLHQIMVQINNWTLIGPISIDKVGIFFRYCTLDLQYKKRTRIVFDISLIGSAQKLITVKSALKVVNKISRPLMLKMDMKNEIQNITAVINPNDQLSIPLRYVDSFIYLKPISSSQLYDNSEKQISGYFRTNSNESDEIGFCTRAVTWSDCVKDSIQDLHSCFGNNKSVFHTLVEIKRDKYPNREIANLPAHTVTLLPPLKLKNMLCCDLIFKISGHIEGRLNPSESVDIYTVNSIDSFNLSITLDNYKLSGQLKIPMGHTGVVEPKLKLIDILNRELYLRVSIQSFQGRGLEIYISAPVWIINKTGLPLVYKQEGTNNLASGQFEEHEKARVVSPLMFSFSDQEGSPSLEIRLGKSFGNNNTWCKSFNIHKETIYRELRAERSKGCYAIGINVRRGRGLYSCTTFITLSPRFQLYNKTCYKLEFAQKCDIKNTEITSVEKIISALPGCNFPFHWPNYEQEPLLCIRIPNIEFCYWSNGIPMNEAQSIYINIRNDLGEMFFLRLEVISKGATYYLLFTNANKLPPPIRIDNYSEVAIHFSQFGCKPYWRTPVRPHSSLAYALDDPLGLHSLQIEAPGGNTIEFSLNKIEVSQSITYANFIYIAFKETFKISASDSDIENGIEGQQLVLGVKDRKVILMKKCAGDRSQLWLMNSNGNLEHEGSSPPTELKFEECNFTRMVLDIERAPNPTEYSNLVIRSPNKQRVTTQTWRFENGRLMCHANMCVQARNGFYGLYPGADAVLGQIESNSRIKNDQKIPFDQSIEIQKLRPGSGHLEVVSKMDGPIQTIQIHDVKSNKEDVMLNADPSWSHASMNSKKIIDESKHYMLKECSFKFELLKGLGVSIVMRQPCEELAYITFDNIVVDIISTPFIKAFDLKVADLQIDNQLIESSCPVLLYTLKLPKEESAESCLQLRGKILPSPNKNAVIFEYLTFDLNPCIVCLEERLILKMAIFFGLGNLPPARTDYDLEDEAYHIEENAFSKDSKRFYFENLSIGPSQIRLSVFTASKLSQELSEMKKALRLTLIKFEDALIEFDKFSDKHHFETLDVYLKAIKTHYINQIKWHAASILGSVDFLGNPLGFANDLSEGVSGLIFEGSVKSLVKNVTHGLSNSTAKLTETLSDSLGKVVLDEQDNETRQKILEITTNSSTGHLAAGLKGFGFGILGGVTSIVRHAYVGAQSEGFPGFISGLGKGLVGTVTKPIIGVLDLASETASAVRESSKGSHRNLPDRKRLPRCVTGAPGGLLPQFSYRQSKGQQYLYVINHRKFSEKLMSYEPNLCNDKEAKLRLLVSTDYVRIFSRCDDDPAIMFECHLSEVLSCHALTANTGASSSKVTPSYYIEISTNLPKVTRPRVRCQNEEIAERAARCINYAKSVYDEKEQSVDVD